MKDFLIKNKFKLIISLFLIIFVFLILNTKNIYKLLKGNINEGSEFSTLITSEMINNMSMYDILAEVQGHDENGKLRNYLFNSDGIPTFTLDAGEFPNVYKMKISMRFQSNHKDSNGEFISKKAKIILNEGINLVSSDSEQILPQLKDKSVSSIKHANASSFNCYKYGSNVLSKCNSKNGDITYEFDSSVEIVTFTMTISPDGALDFTNIEDAIRIELLENNSVINSITKDVNEDFSESPIVVLGNNPYHKNLGSKDSNVESYNYKDNIMGFDSYDLRGRDILFEYIKMVVKAPKEVKLIGTKNMGISVTTIGYPFEGKNIPNYDDSIIAPNTSIEVTKKGDYNIYTFIATDLYTHCYGVVPVWDFSEYNVGDIVNIEGVSLTYKSYGSEETTILLNSTNENSNKSYDEFTIVDSERITIKNLNEEIYSFDEEHPDDQIHLSSYYFNNSSPYSMLTDNISFKFDDNVLVSSGTFPLMADIKDVKVSFKKKWYDKDSEEWVVSEKYIEKELKGINAFSFQETGDKNFQFFLSKNDLGLLDDEYIAELNIYKLTIPAYYETLAYSWSYGFYGGVIDKTKSEIGTTISISNSNNTITNTSINKINTQVKQVTAYPLPKENKNIVISSNKINTFKFTIKEAKEKQIYRVRRTYNPIIYIRSETGLPINNIILKNNNGDDLIKKYNLIIESYSESSTIENKKECKIGEACIYKIDTKNVPSDETVIGFTEHKVRLIESKMDLEFDIFVPIDFSDGGTIHKFNDMIYVTDQSSNDVYVYSPLYLKGDKYDVDLDGKLADDVMSYMNSQYFYQVVSDKDLTSTIMQKQSDEQEYILWKSNEDNSLLSYDKNLNLRLELYNNSGKKITNKEEALLYIPIPKKEENWYDLSNDNSFGLSLNLINKLNINNKENIKYDIYYGINEEPKNDFNSLKEIKFENLTSENNITNEQLKNVNFVVIKINELETNNKISIDINLELDNHIQREVLEQQFKYVLYRNLSTSQGEVKSGFVLGNMVGFSNKLTYNLNVIHKDIYDKILDAEYYIKASGEKYETAKKEFDNYEILLEPLNAVGEIKEDTIVTYVYKSTLDRKVIIHYYEKSTKNKLIEDKILTGKDLEAFEIKPEIINGYKVVDDKKIKGSFKEEVQEFIYEYEKEAIIVPSTLDNIISSIVIFVLSITTIIFIVVYVRKKKKLD